MKLKISIQSHEQIIVLETGNQIQFPCITKLVYGNPVVVNCSI